MCVVASWSRAENKEVESRPSVLIQHIEEALLYALAQSRIDILLTVLVLEGSPLYMYLTHRRGVIFEDLTSSLISANGPELLGSLINTPREGQFQGRRTSSGVDISKKGGTNDVP